MFGHRGNQQGRRGGLQMAQLWAWGNGQRGGLGLNSIVSRSSPVQIGGLEQWASIATGTADGLAVKKDGTLWTWGRSFYAASGGQGDIILRSSPTIVGDLSNWKQVWTTKDWQYTASSSFGIKQDGTLWSWGHCQNGELGINITGSNTTGRSSPVQIGSQTDWLQGSASGYASFAIKNNGTLWGWGSASNGLLGNNSTVLRSSPIQVGSDAHWAQVAGGWTHALAIRTDGTLWSWGRNNIGQLGRSNTTDVSSPVQIGGDTNWASISAGLSASFAIKTNGTLWAWGEASTHGQLGRNNLTDISSPAQVGSDTNWKKVSAGRYNILAVKTDGTLWAWGQGQQGRLGNNATASLSSPTQIGTDKKWIDVSANYGVSLALKLP